MFPFLFLFLLFSNIIMAFKKYVKRVARRVRGKVIKRYFNKGYKPKIGTMVRDINMLKGLVNAEKKRININDVSSQQLVGQVNGATTSGHYIIDVTPAPVQGTGYSDRTGNSIKWTSSYFEMQFYGETSMINEIKLDIYLIKVNGLAQSSVGTTVPGQFFLNNPFCNAGTIYDSYCQRNPDYFKNFRVLRRIKTSVKSDSISGETSLRSVNFGLKLKNHHCKWQANTTTLTEGQVCLLIVCNNGNCSTTTNCTISQGVPTTAMSTGLLYNYNINHYFIDN